MSKMGVSVELEELGELASCRSGGKFEPALWRTPSGFSVRVISRVEIKGNAFHISYAYYDLGPQGKILKCPPRRTNEFKGRVVHNIEYKLAEYADKACP